MNFERVMILLGAIWCAFCLCVSLVGGAVVLGCYQQDACADPGYEAAHVFAPYAWWTIPMFAAGAIMGFRAVWRYLKFPKIAKFRLRARHK